MKKLKGGQVQAFGATSSAWGIIGSQRFRDRLLARIYLQ